MIVENWLFVFLIVCLLLIAYLLWQLQSARARLHAVQRDILIAQQSLTAVAAEADRSQLQVQQLRAAHEQFQSERLTHASVLARSAAGNERMVGLQQEIQNNQALLEQTRAASSQLAQDLAAMRAQRESELAAAAEKLSWLEAARESLTQQFKLVSSELLNRESVELKAQNLTQVQGIVEPLRERLKEFSGLVQQYRADDQSGRAVLKQELSTLQSMNQRLSDEASQLSRALTGKSKIQGGWGEMVLERLLLAAGLQRDIHFSMQQVFKDEGQNRLQPDVVLKLPQDRAMAVDAKVSLTAYAKYVAEPNDEARQGFMQEHVQSMRTHVKDLSQRAYHRVVSSSAPELVLMFVPIESAWLDAVNFDKELLESAMKQNIAIVTPSSLLATSRVLAHVWAQANAEKNAEAIAEMAGSLYDKFCGLAKDLSDARAAQNKASGQLDDALNKLQTGRGNLLGRVEKMRELGARSSKQLPDDWKSAASLELPPPPDAE
jgi:DNA recombination protein RmuC